MLNEAFLYLNEYIICFLKNGSIPLHYACRYGYKEIAVALMDRGADIHVKNKVSAYMESIIQSL